MAFSGSELKYTSTSTASTMFVTFGVAQCIDSSRVEIYIDDPRIDISNTGMPGEESLLVSDPELGITPVQGEITDEAWRMLKALVPYTQTPRHYNLGPIMSRSRVAGYNARVVVDLPKGTDINELLDILATAITGQPSMARIREENLRFYSSENEKGRVLDTLDMLDTLYELD